MKKPSNFIIPLVVYPFDVMVSIGETDEQLRKQFGRYDLEVANYFDHDVTKARSSLFPTGQTVIRFRSRASTDHESIAHEVFHAVTHLLSFIGMPLNLKHNDEAYAYLIGYLTAEIYKRL